MKKLPFLKTLFYFSIFFGVLWGSHAWFTWWIGGTGAVYRLVSIVLMMFAFLYQAQCNVSLKKTNTIIAIIVFYLLALNISGFLGIASVIGSIIKLYPLLVLASAPQKDQKEILLYVSKGLGFILVLGLIAHFLILLGVPFPTIPVTRNGYYINYILDLKIVFVLDLFANIRFMSVFLEPGYLGVLMAFMLYANRFNMKSWYNKVFLISLLASFSLGGYMVMLICYGLFLYSKNKLNFRSVAVSLLVLTAIVVAAERINDGNNMLNHLILERLVISNDEKVIIGNNRFSEGTDYYYEQYQDRLLLGLGIETVSKLSANVDYEDGITGAGYKVYFLTYGILSAIFMLFFYMVLGLSYTKNKKYTYCYILVLIITFVFQAELTSPAWYYIFFLGCACCEQNNSPKHQITVYGKSN